MKKYLAILNHDGGTVRLTVRVSSVELARKMILAAEGCPARAIQWIGVCPTKKQVAKTKRDLASF